jgi:hypothetical protein
MTDTAFAMLDRLEKLAPAAFAILHGCRGPAESSPKLL